MHRLPEECHKSATAGDDASVGAAGHTGGVLGHIHALTASAGALHPAGRGPCCCQGHTKGKNISLSPPCCRTVELLSQSCGSPEAACTASD